MDTKWKSRIGILAWLILFTYGVSGVFTALFDDNDFTKRSYFETRKFENHVERLLSYIDAFEISYQSKEDLTKSLTVTKDEIEEYRSRFGDFSEQKSSIELQYESRIQEAQNEKDQKAIDTLIEERDKKIEEITTIFENDEYVTEQILLGKQEKWEEYYQEVESHRAEYEKYKSAFFYYLKNTQSAQVYTNLEAKEIINEENTHYISSYPANNQTYPLMNDRPFVWSNDEEISNRVRQSSNAFYEGEIGISKNIPNSNFIMLEYRDFQVQRTLFWFYTAGAILALLLAIIIEKRKSILRRIVPEIWKNLYNKVPIDVALFLFAVSAILTLALSFEKPYLFYSKQITGMIEIIFYHLITITIIFGITIVQGAYLYRRLKDVGSIREDWKHSLFARFLNLIRNAFQNRRVGTQVFLILTIVFLFGLVTGLLGVDENFFALLIPAFFIVGIPLFIIILKRISYFNKILINARALAKGEFEADLKIVGKSVLANLAEDLNKMKYGVKTSQHAQVKSERLKTELITNVSHDLRTPLTSIMTYSELLKNPNLSEGERNSYIEIIDRKSNRLKVLIDDLFEASKMASGNVELVKERVDINQLLHQALAEYNETIKESTIQFRVSTPDNPVYARVDGKKMWRVFENLIGNILKYSLENTRAYIHVNEENGQVLVTFKNISKYELSNNIDELFERFKRGDESRHTEGSGLGLSIAKSIIDLHEGSLDIEVDADLFKVEIKLEMLGKK